MNRRIFFLALFMVTVLVLSLFPVRASADSARANLERLYGRDRIETALAVCAKGWDRADTVVLAPANQENLVDAVLAVPLAGQEGAPILLTDRNTLDSRVLDRIKTLQAGKVILVGAVSSSTLAELRTSLTGIHTEVLKGKDRVETARLVNSKLNRPGGTFVVGYNSLADALSAASYAADNSYAFAFAGPGGRLIEGQELYGDKVYILGGPGLVMDIPGAVRISGSDRYETNKKVADYFSCDFRNIYIAGGRDESLADAVTGSVLAGKTHSPLYLADCDGYRVSAEIRDRLDSGSTVFILGGPGAVSEETGKRIAGIVDPGSGNSENNSVVFKVNSVKPLGLLQVAVEFSGPVHKISAENVSSYVINGRSLTTLTGSAELQEDGRTVVITLDTPQTRYSLLTVEVKDHEILSVDRESSAPGYIGTVVMNDKKVPQVLSAVPEGSRKLTVRFSEAVCLSEEIAAFEYWKVDGRPLTSLGLSTVRIPEGMKINGKTYGSSLEFYFSAAFGEGGHVLEISSETPAGMVSSFLRDGAGLLTEESALAFNVQKPSDVPGVRFEGVAGRAVYLHFDRPMYSNPLGTVQADNADRASVLNVNSYSINDRTGNVVKAEFQAGSARKTVKLTLADRVLVPGLNVISIDPRIEDMFGNRLDGGDESRNNIRLLFKVERDEVKPRVERVELVSPSKIRVRFSEPVSGLYALNPANYILKDPDGIRIAIANIKGIADSENSSGEAYPDCDMYELETAIPLYGRGYSLKIKNIQDISLAANVMDTAEFTFGGTDNAGPRVREVLGANEGNTVVVFFTESMAESTLTDLSNYAYQDGNSPARIRALPAGTTITAGPEKKSAVLSFPSAFRVDADSSGIGGLDPAYRVTAVQVYGVKDENGHLLEGGSQLADIILPGDSAFRPGYVPDSFAVLDDEDDGIVAEFKLDQVITDFVYQDFLVGKANNKITADGAWSDGRKIFLRFTDPAKVSEIRSLGRDLRLFSTDNPQSGNIAGVRLSAFPAEGYQVYDDRVKPRVLGWSLEESAQGDDYVLLTLSEAVDSTVLGLYEDDFVLYFGGTDVKVQGVRIYKDDQGNEVPNVLVYDLIDGDYNRDGMKIRMVKDNSSIRDVEDRKGDFNPCAYSGNLKFLEFWLQ